MFFMFCILVFTISVTRSDNLILNSNDTQANNNFEEHFRTPGTKSYSSYLLHLVNNMTIESSINNKTRDKRHADNTYTQVSPKLRTENERIEDPKLVLKEKWPRVEFVANPDSNDHLQYLMELQKKYQDSSAHVVNNEYKHFRVPNKTKSRDTPKVHGNHLKDKVVDLRSVTTAGLAQMLRCQTENSPKQCSCTKNNPNPTPNNLFNTHSCTGRSHKAGCTRDAATEAISYTVVPVYVPSLEFYSPPIVYYPPDWYHVLKTTRHHKRKKVKPRLEEDLYYYDNDKVHECHYDEGFVVNNVGIEVEGANSEEKNDKAEDKSTHKSKDSDDASDLFSDKMFREFNLTLCGSMKKTCYCSSSRNLKIASNSLLLLNLLYCLYY